MEVKKLALLPKESLTDREQYLYSIYCAARSSLTGSMMEIAGALDISNTEFYRLLDSDVEFANAIKCGLSDSRQERCLQLESCLVDLAIGATTTEDRLMQDEDGHIVTTKVTRKNPPNLSAIQLLLEHYEGSRWRVDKEVSLNSGTAPQEIDYKMLSKEQLRKLSNSGTITVEEEE